MTPRHGGRWGCQRATLVCQPACVFGEEVEARGAKCLPAWVLPPRRWRPGPKGPGAHPGQATEVLCQHGSLGVAWPGRSSGNNHRAFRGRPRARRGSPAAVRQACGNRARPHLRRNNLALARDRQPGGHPRSAHGCLQGGRAVTGIPRPRSRPWGGKAAATAWAAWPTALAGRCSHPGPARHTLRCQPAPASPHGTHLSLVLRDARTAFDSQPRVRLT